MKILARLATVVCLAIVVGSFIACGGDGGDPKPPVEPTEKEKVTTLLKANGSTWSAASGSIKVDDVDRTEDLFGDGFTIKFGDGTLTTSGTTPVWPAADTWTFKDDQAKVIIRGSDSKEIPITVTATQLTLTLEWDEYTYEEGGRSKSIPGTYVFTLNK